MYSIFYKLLPVKKKIADADIHLLNDVEIRIIKKIEKIAIIFSAFIGCLMVFILNIPKYRYSHIFKNVEISIFFLDQPILINFASIIYGITLVFLEVVLLTLLHIYCTHEISTSTGFINNNNKFTSEKRDFIFRISHQKKNKKVHDLGIYPYLGLNDSTVFFMNLMFALKATLSNFFIKLIFQRLLGRYGLRILLDFSGIPVFAFWNAYGTWKILMESRINIMGINYLNNLKFELSAFRELNDDEKSILYDTLQLIAVSKRDYHQNHYILSKFVIETFSIKTEPLHLISNEYESKLKSCKLDFKQINEKILIFGFMLDGNVSYREKKRIKKLNDSGVLHHSFEEIRNMTKDFIYGKGIAYVI
jgi:hypothetical protein